jgi:hypothetical protein
MTSTMEWQLGGWLRTWPSALAWGTLALIGLAGLWMVFWSYRRALGSAPRGVRLGLTATRAILVLLLLVGLANPTRVVRRQPEKPSRTLAVLVDRSISMSRPDRRGMTRLADATRTWRAHETEAAEAFTAVTYHRFALGRERSSSFQEAVTSHQSGARTHLFAALRQAVNENPAAIVCLTDGLDNSPDPVADIITAATERGVPLYFVVGKNRLRPADEGLTIREVRIPAQVLRQSEFAVSVLAEVVAPGRGAVPVELWRGTTKLAATNPPVQEGRNSLFWTVEVPAGEPALLPLEFRFGTGPRQQVAGRTTRVVESASVELLYYQGALQWGYRFLRGALESDPGFRVTAILNPALGVHLSVGGAEASGMADLPADARELKRFQMVVLAHAFADLLTRGQQQALLDYVRDGGGVLFVSPDTDATRRFSGTVLEQLLPVVFESSGSSAGEQLQSRFHEQMRVVGGASVEVDPAFPGGVIERQTLPALQPIRPVPGAASARLFPASMELPHFGTYARVQAVKPGAEVLAVHPTDGMPGTDSPRVLIARQRFGNGFAAVMNTDLLWRWKLSLPSSSRAVETFWQQWLLSLSPPARGPMVELTTRTEFPQVQRPVTLRVTGVTGAVPALEIQSPQGSLQRLSVSAVDIEGQGAWEASFTPDEPGCWRVKAGEPEAGEVQISISVASQARTAELLDLPPDMEGLRHLAEATGGALIGVGRSVFEQFSVEQPAETVSAQPSWNQGWLLVLWLGGYAAELVGRRLFRLL